MALFYEIHYGQVEAYVTENVSESIKNKGRLARPKSQQQLVPSHLTKKLTYFNNRNEIIKSFLNIEGL